MNYILTYTFSTLIPTISVLISLLALRDSHIILIDTCMIYIDTQMLCTDTNAIGTDTLIVLYQGYNYKHNSASLIHNLQLHNWSSSLLNRHTVIMSMVVTIPTIAQIHRSILQTVVYIRSGQISSGSLSSEWNMNTINLSLLSIDMSRTNC